MLIQQGTRDDYIQERCETILIDKTGVVSKWQDYPRVNIRPRIEKESERNGKKGYWMRNTFQNQP